jgi:hypothetical protein
VVVPLAAAPAQAAEVAWHGPAECADPRQTLEEAERLLGRSLGGVQAADFEINVANEGEQRWTLALTTTERRTGDRRQRVLTGKSCAEVTSTAAVALAMVVEASESSASDRTQPAVVQPKVDEPAASKPQRAAPNAVEPRARDARRKLGVALSASFAGDTGSLPGVAPGAELGAAVRSGFWQVAGFGALYVGNDRQENGRGADLTLGLGGVLACARAESGRVRPLLCAGGEVGWLAGTGVGVKNPHTGGALWVAARIEAGLSVPLGPSFAVLGRFGAAVPLERRQFVIDGDVVVHEPKALAGRLFLGVEFAL